MFVKHSCWDTGLFRTPSP